MRLLRLILILLGWFFLLSYAYSDKELTPKDVVKSIVWAVVVIENGIYYHITYRQKEKQEENE